MLRTELLLFLLSYIYFYTNFSNIYQFSYTYTIYISLNTNFFQLFLSKKTDCKIFILFINYLYLYKSIDYFNHSGSFCINRMKQLTIFQPIYLIYTYLQNKKYTYISKNLVVWRKTKSLSNFYKVWKLYLLIKIENQIGLYR